LKSSKVFGIGLNKTGTTTLSQCLYLLGHKAAPYNDTLLEDVCVRKDFSKLNEWVDQYDSFEDWPYPLIFEELDRMYPGSKFILTTRKSPETWVNSLKKHSLTTHPLNHSRKLMYGHAFPHGRENQHIKIYNEHNQRVRDYFRDRPNDLIELCWERGDGWKELCAFLSCEIPETPFPHTNTGASRTQGVSRKWKYANLFLSRIQLLRFY
jgi:hypothetical protein